MDIVRNSQTAFRFRAELLARIKNKARINNMSVNRYVESILEKELEGKDDSYEKIYEKLKGVQLKPEPSNEIRELMDKHIVRFGKDEICLDEKLAYILDK